jgi:two-component system cell cycle sensor histidine kinase/response regulator CckA
MIVFSNPMTNKIAGYSDEELMSVPFINFIYTDDRKLVAERYSKRMKGIEVPASYSFRLKHKSGEPRWVSANAVMINWNEKPATLNFISDITDRKLLEEERQRVEKLESIGIMAGGIAHDFNNLLTAIIGNISLVKIIGKQDDDSLTILEDAEKASMRAKSLTQQLLTFAKGGAPVKKNMAIADLLKESAGFILRGSNIKCQWSIPSNLWNVEIDEGQVNQVINNLILNAQQAMPTGGKIEINAENLKLTANHDLVKKESLPVGNYIRISITDHGVGIHHEYLDKIFDPFFTTKQKGSGLGLATSYSIVKNHGGYINAESSPGSGTTFFVYLPASRKYKKRPSRDKSRHIPGEERVLIMDDEASVREVLGRMLKHMNYRDIVYAREGEEAVRLYKEGMETGVPFNIVILDLTIPGGMGGKETMEKLRKINPAVKAIVSSGYSTESIIAEYDKYGFSGVITKPYNIDQLRDILAEMGKSD